MAGAKRFSKVNIEISNICNLQCSFCPEVMREKGLMDPSLFSRIVTQVAPLADQVCFHLMGDPLVHPNLSNLLDICHEQAVKVFFVTNGVLLNEKSVGLLLHPALRQVNFSLHSFHDNFGDKDATSYLERIFAYTDRAFIERPDLYINYRMWDLKAGMATAVEQEGIYQAIERRFEVQINRQPDVRIHKGRVLKNRLYLHFDTQFIWPDVSLPLLGSKGTCYGLSNHFGILVDGTVVPCCLDKEGKIPLGNVREQALVDILASPRALAMQKGFSEGRLVEDLCQKCQYIERFQNKSFVQKSKKAQSQLVG